MMWQALASSTELLLMFSEMNAAFDLWPEHLLKMDKENCNKEDVNADTL